MSQLSALVWLKWRLFRNTLRSRRAVTNRLASAIGMLAALALALLVAVSLGFAAYALNSPPRMMGAGGLRGTGQAFLFLFFLFMSIFLMWALVPLGLGSGNQFDPSRFLLYPVSLFKIFLTDLVSDFVSLTSIFAVPVALAVSLGAGLRAGRPLSALALGMCGVLFGILFGKFLATSTSALLRKRRTRGETMLAIAGAALALGGTFAGQLMQYFLPRAARYENTLSKLWWTPPGALAAGLTEGLRAPGAGVLFLSFATLAAYAFVLVALTFWVARRAALSAGGARRETARVRTADATNERLTGWHLPFVSPQLSAVVEKEWRYVTRNAQVRLLVLMPLILVGLRFIRRTGAERDTRLLEHAGRFVELFERYGQGLVEAGGVLYVFLLLSALMCNQFAFEGGGMTAYVLAPVERRTILLGKNAVVTALAFLYTSFFLVVTYFVFRDLTFQALLFAALSFMLYAALWALVGNWFSMRYPRRLNYGKRLNLTGVTGLMILPFTILIGCLPLAAVAAGYVAQSLLVKYATLAALAALALVLYFRLINAQGHSLERRQRDILEIVGGRNETEG